MSLTSADAVIMMSVLAVFPIPQQLQGFDTDNIFDTDPIESVETRMGVDGKLSGGFVFKEVKQSYMLQADSPSNFFFDQWWATMQALQQDLAANGLVVLPALGSKWTLTNGFLTSYKPLPAAKKLLEARTHVITWERAFPTLA